MIILRPIPVLALALLAAAAIPTTASAASKSKSCSHRGSKTLASNSTSRVYKVDTPDGGDDGMTLDNIFGCWRNGDRRTLLATEYDDDYVTSGRVNQLVLGGRYVLVLFTAEDISCKAACPPDYDPTVTDLTAYDLKRRKHKRLDVGDKIDAKSLKISGTTATWTVDGEPKSASLS
jgi:hypothetical protein